MRAGLSYGIYGAKAYAEIATPSRYWKNLDLYASYGAFFLGVAVGKFTEIGIDFQKEGRSADLKLGLTAYHDVTSIWFPSQNNSQVKFLPRIAVIWRK